MTGQKVKGHSKVGDQIQVNYESVKAGKEESIMADVVLVSTGRRPFTDKLGLDKVGIKVDEKGRVEIDELFRTNLPGVFAIGDVVKGAMLAHKAEEEGIACVE